MWKILIPKKIAYGENAAKEFDYPDNALIITTTESKIYEKWTEYMGIKNYTVYDKVTPDPAIETIESIKNEFEGKNISCYIGLGGGSSMDVCKYLSKLTGVPKILIPTTFGTGAEMTTYAVISFDHKKKLLQDEAFWQMPPLLILISYLERLSISCVILHVMQLHKRQKVMIANSEIP